MNVVLAEKPSMAKDIADALGALEKHDGYYEGNGYQVTWAFGHLVQLAPFDYYSEDFKKWNLESLPFMPDKFKLIVNSDKGAKKQFGIIKKLILKSQHLTAAGDAAREGELIARYIFDVIGVRGKKIERLWISSLTRESILNGFKNLRDSSEFDNLAAAAKARSEADWLVGLNATRAFTVKYSNFSGVLSIGRVQTPILAMIVKRDLEHKQFEPSKFYQLISSYKDIDFQCTVGRINSIEEVTELREKVVDKAMTIVDISGKDTIEKPPQLYDLTTLQRQMSANYGLTATETLSTLQGLYEKKLMTYPRTDSRYLTDDMYKQCSVTLSKLSKRHSGISKLDLSNLRNDKNIFDTSKVNDHHAVIPTGLQSDKLNDNEQKLYDSILKRFVSVFYPNCKKRMTTVLGRVNQFDFEAKGTAILEKGWREIESPGKESFLPIFRVGESGAQMPRIENGTTRPPALFTESSLLGMMETAGHQVEDKALRAAMKESGLGTPATRAGLIETLLQRNYIVRLKKNIIATEKGKALIETIKFDDLKSPSLTGDWEYKLKLIEKGELLARDFINEVKSYVTRIIDSVKFDSGENIISSSVDLKEPLGKCCLCGSEMVFKGKLYACENSEECTFVLWKKQFNKELKHDHVRQLLTQGRTEKLKGLKKKDGSTFDAALKMSEGKVVPFFESSLKLGKCPLCNNGEMSVNQKVAKCNKCDYRLWRNIASIELSIDNLETLFQSGKTGVILGFKSKGKNKSFSAALSLTESGELKFIFPRKNLSKMKYFAKKNKRLR